jgi:hypothetical protein
MPARCTICSHANVQEMDDLAHGGESLISISERFHVSRFALSRHCKHRKPEPVAENTGGDSQEEIQVWLDRANDQYLLAVADADQRGAVTALVAGLRAVETKMRSVQQQEETTPEVDPQLSIEAIDRIMREADAARTPEVALVDDVAWWVRRQLLYSADPFQLQMILEFLKCSLVPDRQCWFSGHATNAALIAAFDAYVAKRVLEGDRVDIPPQTTRAKDGLFRKHESTQEPRPQCAGDVSVEGE